MSSIPAPNRHPPFLEVTPTDHGAWVAIATALGLCCALVTSMLRIFVRARINPPFAHDDIVIFAAMGFATIQSSIVLYGVSKGLGKSVNLISPENLQAVQKAAYASDILYIFSVYLAKCSVIFLLLRLTSKRRHRVAFRTTLAVSTVWLLASIVAIALRCDLSQPWVLLQEKCTTLLLRWQLVMACDIALEVVIFALSFYLIHGLQMATRNKFIVMGAFGFRLAVVPLLIIRIISFPRHHLSTDPAFTLTYFYIWTQTTLCLSLMTTMIPCLKPIVTGLNTGYGAFDTAHVTTQVYGVYGSNGYAPETKRTKHSSNLPSKSEFTSAKGSKSHFRAVIGKERSTVDGEVGSRTTGRRGHQSRPTAVVMDMDLGLNPEVACPDEERCEAKAVDSTEVVAHDGNSIGSNDSRQMIIRKDVAWAVEYSAP